MYTADFFSWCLSLISSIRLTPNNASVHDGNKAGGVIKKRVQERKETTFIITTCAIYHHKGIYCSDICHLSSLGHLLQPRGWTIIIRTFTTVTWANYHHLDIYYSHMGELSSFGHLLQPHEWIIIIKTITTSTCVPSIIIRTLTIVTCTPSVIIRTHLPLTTAWNSAIFSIMDPVLTPSFAPPPTPTQKKIPLHTAHFQVDF